MENMDRESPPRSRNQASFTLDTHAMAYKLMLAQDDGETCSEHGTQARRDFYQNRSRSDGASAVVRSQLRELRRVGVEEEEDPGDVHEEDRSHRRSSLGGAQRKLSEPSRLSVLARDYTPDEEPMLEMPARGAPVHIPAVDSSSDLPALGRTTGRRLFAEDRFVAYFALPSPSFTLHCLLDERTVCLESVECPPGGGLSATVLARRWPQPGCQPARVFGRWTVDGWRSSRDTEAVLATPCAHRPNVDRYLLMVDCGRAASGARLELAVAYEVRWADGRTAAYWDNNNHANYAFWYSA